VLYLSADDSNSMGSPALAREELRAHTPPFLIRTYEFLNCFSFDYPAPPVGELAIFAEMAPAEETGQFDMQLAVRSFDAPEQRRPMTITFVLDTSGSMGGVPIERERAVVMAIAENLAAGDIVNMVTWNTSNAVVMAGHEVSGPNDPKVLEAAGALQSGGGTDLNGGLKAGYQLANQHYGELRLNRIVLISDGGANVGVTDADLIGINSEDGDKEGIYLVGVGTGPPAGYSDQLMDAVTDAGRGAYVYVDSEDEARHMFVERFDEVMEVAARAVQVELTLPWYFQMHKFYGEEYSENPEEVDPQHLAPSDAMVFHQVLRACDPAVVVDADEVKVAVRWQQPITYSEHETSFATTVGALLAGDADRLLKGKAIVAYAEALRSGEQADLQAAHQRIEAAGASSDPELAEIAKLIQMHPSY